jgi:Exopolysaccharide biosynthesis protein YbjH
MRKGWVLLALVGLATVRPALAAPNYLGSTGLLMTPSADVLQLREWNAHVHGSEDFTTYGASFGLFENLEVGVTGYDFKHGGGTNALINAKYRLVPESKSVPAIAVGAVDISDEFNVDPSIYLVISKALGMVSPGGTTGLQLRGHVGVGQGIYDTVFGGVDLILTPRLLLMAEYDSSDFNFGARLGLTPEVRADLSVLDGKFGAGLSYVAAF